jgi:hypothetical protein
VIIYVEGRSDVSAMNELLRGLIALKGQAGVRIQFFEAPPGYKKESVMRKVPRRAANILRNNPNALVVAMPDLYPYGVYKPHTTFQELEAIILDEFRAVLRAMGMNEDKRYLERFKVFCFKHDLEALVLAAQDALAFRLAADKLTVAWRIPVEDQNNDTPPKRVVADLFNQHGHAYSPTVDAPLILGMADYRNIAEACPQCFEPFVQFLEGIDAS